MKEERNMPQTMKRRKDKWVVRILRRNCLLKHVTEGQAEGRMEDEEEDVNSFWMTFGTSGDIGN
jgi:hypothetical protein